MRSAKYGRAIRIPCAAFGAISWVCQIRWRSRGRFRHNTIHSHYILPDGKPSSESGLETEPRFTNCGAAWLHALAHVMESFIWHAERSEEFNQSPYEKRLQREKDLAEMTRAEEHAAAKADALRLDMEKLERIQDGLLRQMQEAAAGARAEAKKAKAANAKLTGIRKELERIGSKKKGEQSAMSDNDYQRVLSHDNLWLCYTSMGDKNGMQPTLIQELLDVARNYDHSNQYKNVDDDDGAKREGEGTRKQIILKHGVTGPVKQVTFVFQDLLAGAGYTYLRGVYILKGGASVQNRHNDAGVPGTSLSILVALTDRRFTVCHTNGVGGGLTLDLKQGDVAIFNTHVYHRGEQNAIDSYAMFLFFDLTNSNEETGYTDMFIGPGDEARNDRTGDTWEGHCTQNNGRVELIRTLGSVYEIPYWLHRDTHSDMDIINCYSTYQSKAAPANTNKRQRP